MNRLTNFSKRDYVIEIFSYAEIHTNRPDGGFRVPCFRVKLSNILINT